MSDRLSELKPQHGAIASPDLPPQLELLFKRCCTLAGRVLAGNLPFIDAVDMAYSAAQWAGVVDRYGDDVVQAVLVAAFMETPRGPTCTA